ncbi:glucose-1-phosphate adenylyltransferase [Rhodococcus sp. Leaf7]|uniref:glucose-1-phosphate adenylyltransferase n=1 Tax=unclassified Rhodococcus (in: high G+C Gram-positive bacteria) TaxID=192944 RepID=UPI0005AC00BF|nr:MULTISPECIES: glucose-1-phosphate adenylyltransferase [unclassified Rhodococcus (in: high G+C Gram-positive bacteria)]KIQ17186.1 glucose-1-phosphate adenylyltransferase [Rhodococcus sp. MEB064]KQU06477.1 glucose-1-phosphate adenylyltransferase [Rhodococcus sp. Leaf7]KQU41995.1 glucose-1-phosphate adenylyltransferase [Rhodococcus sp. Leaf247]
MRTQPHVLGIVLAGGEGKRLYPMTADRAKPAVPFGGAYRLIDFVLSNLVNAGYLRLCVLTQYKSHSLDRHISQTWRLSGFAGEYITPVPAQQRLGPRWYTGSADAIFQSMNLITDEDPEYIVVFGADHVYRMDPEQMVQQHIDSGAGVTVAGIRVPRSEATAFGCIDSDASGNITEFLEKPKDPPGTPDDPTMTFASMGNYVFTTKVLVDAIRADAEDTDSDHDMGGNIIPALVAAGMASVYDFKDNVVPGATERDKGYWRDVGTLDAFYDAHMDLVSVHPIFNLYNKRWPIRGSADNLPPAKFVQGGLAQESIVGAGSILSGATVRNSVLSSSVIIDAGATVEGSVIMPGVRIGKNAVVRNAILDKNVVVGDGEIIGVDRDRDAERFNVSANGVVAVGKGVWI